MNTIIIIALSLVTIPFCWGTDAITQAYYSALKVSIEQIQPLELVQETWNALATTHALAQPALSEIASQALAYAREQKATREQELAALGNATYDSSKRTKGIAYAAFGLWCLASFGRYGRFIYTPEGKRVGDLSIDYLLFPITLAIYKEISSLLTAHSCLLAGLAIDLTAPYFLYKGYRTIRDAYTYKQTLLTQIEHLTATIQFFEHQISPEVGV